MKIIIFGGAELHLGQFLPQLKMIEKVIKKYKPKQVLHIPFARPKATEVEWEDGWFQRHINIGTIVYLNAKNKADIAKAKNPLVLISGGGGNVVLLKKIQANPLLLKLVRNASVIVAESAGAKVLGEKFRTIGSDPNSKLAKGLGLVPESIIEPHYTERHRQKLLDLDLKESGLKYGIGVDCATALELDTKYFPDKCKRIGQGNIDIKIRV